MMGEGNATTSDPVEGLVGPDCVFGVLGLLVAVPREQRENAENDIAEAYAVEVGHDIPKGCIVWGMFDGKWQPNVSARWIVSQFIKGASEMLHNEKCGGIEWWNGCTAVMEMVSIQRPGGDNNLRGGDHVTEHQ